MASNRNSRNKPDIVPRISIGTVLLDLERIVVANDFSGCRFPIVNREPTCVRHTKVTPNSHCPLTKILDSRCLSPPMLESHYFHLLTHPFLRGKSRVFSYVSDWATVLLFLTDCGMARPMIQKILRLTLPNERAKWVVDHKATPRVAIGRRQSPRITRTVPATIGLRFAPSPVGLA
jgi:hypothetical protein